MNLTGIPVRPKEPKAKPDSDYLAKVRELPCVICQAFGEPQITPTTAHHPIMGRFSQRKVPDCMAIPLCYSHHQGQAPGDCSVHFHRAEWERRYGADYDYIAITQDMVAKEIEQ